MAGKLTIEDIARLAGVSKATVSRVLNHKPDVDPTTRERVLRIVEEEGFVPSITASGLAVGRSRLIGVLVPSLAQPFIAAVIQGIAELIDATPYELVLYSMNVAAREQGRTNIIDHILATKLTSGLLALFPGVSSATLSDYIAKLQSHNFPVVLIDDYEESVSIPSVTADDFSGGLEAVQHLIKLGHRRIAHIKGPNRVYGARERYRGYCQAMAEASLPVNPTLVYQGDFTGPTGRAIASRLFELPAEERPTAIFAANDPTAYGVLSAAEEYNIDIPGDVALVGFDDLNSSAHVRPALTTVRQPFYEMGQHGLALLLSMLDNSNPFTTLDTFNKQRLADLCLLDDGHPTTRVYAHTVHTGEPLRIQLPTSLIVRSSSGSPRRLSVSSSSL